MILGTDSLKDSAIAWYNVSHDPIPVSPLPALVAGRLELQNGVFMENPGASDPVRPNIPSYDSISEHSLEHYLEVRHMFEEADEGFVFGDRLSYSYDFDMAA